MCPIEDFSPEQRTEFMRVAVIDHFRTWLRFDGPERARIIKNDGKLNGVMVRRISREYNVNRGIRRHHANRDQDPSANAIAEIVNQATQNWPEGLEERAARCAAYANQAFDGNYTHYRLASGISKLIWFVQPTSWTPFDRFTANALGVAGNSNAVTRMTAYYEKLDERGFKATARAINKCLKGNGYGRLSGERVIDKFLMLNGADEDWWRDLTEQCDRFRECLPQQIAESFAPMVENISEHYGPAALTNNIAHA